MKDLLPTIQALILDYLVSRGPSHGYAILCDLRDAIGKSSVYDALYRLESKGFVRSSRDTTVSGPRARRTFEVTGLGATALERHRSAMFGTSGATLGRPAQEGA
ncbi:MAG: helix-turn-helix transcriptional regulator [Chloroflexi bacterium]|nr:helix-turn-helix transcriptional regulator [Chloroflexota bacterium]